VLLALPEAPLERQRKRIENKQSGLFEQAAAKLC